MPEGIEGDEVKSRRWIIDLLFAGGFVLYAITSTVASIWWASSTDTKLATIVETDLPAIRSSIAGLDNVSLGTRITALEVQVRNAGLQQARIETKMDHVLERQSHNR